MKPNRTEQLANEALQLLEKLNRIIPDIIDEDSKDQARSLHSKLSAVNASINSLQQAELDVPEELLSNQQDLQSQLSKFESIEQVRVKLNELWGLAPAAIKKRRSSGRSTRQSSRTSLKELIDASLLRGNEQLIHRETRSGITKRAQITPAGNIEININDHTQTFNNPSAAGQTAAGTRTCNGWDYWSVVTPDGLVSLADYRKKNMCNLKKTQQNCKLKKS